MAPRARRAQGVRDVIIRSDDMWVLMMLESDAKCGEDCRTMRRETAKLEAKSHGLFKFAYTNAHDNLVVQDGSLQVAGAYFNITGASPSPPRRPSRPAAGWGARAWTTAACCRLCVVRRARCQTRRCRLVSPGW